MTSELTQTVDTNILITRRDLYKRVWQTPITKLAKQCGLSVIRLKSLCDKYEVPTPPTGYWTKLAHEKRVEHVDLPESDQWNNDAVLSELSIAPDEAGQSSALQAQIANISATPATRKKQMKYHPIVAKTAGYLKTIATDRHGFACCQQTDMIYVSVSKNSFDRAFKNLHSFAVACEELGYEFEEKRGGIQIVIGSSSFEWRLNESKDRRPHVATKAELQLEARQIREWEAFQEKYPALARSRPQKPYNKWDYYPSGRLAMSFQSLNHDHPKGHPHIRNWHDNKRRSLEACLDKALAALAADAAIINRCKAKKEGQRLIELAEKSRMEHEAAKKERETQRRDFIVSKASDYARYKELISFASFLEASTSDELSEPIHLLLDDLNALIRRMKAGFEHPALSEEIIRRSIFSGVDLG